MSHIQVSHKDDWLLLLEFAEIIEKGGIPLLSPVVNPLESFSSIRSVACHKVELLIFSCENSAFLVMLIDSYVVLHSDWFDFGEDGNSRVALLLLAAVPVLLVVFTYLLRELLYLLNVRLSLVETQDIRLSFFHELLQVFSLKYRIYPIHIPRVDSGEFSKL